MKQTYVKPHMMIERFALTQSIAASCTVAGGNSLGKPTNWSKSTCAWDIAGQLIFLDGMSVCRDEKVASENIDYSGICYNNPDGAMIFSSF